LVAFNGEIHSFVLQLRAPMVMCPTFEKKKFQSKSFTSWHLFSSSVDKKNITVEREP
jgi:hypothetical protein